MRILICGIKANDQVKRLEEEAVKCGHELIGAVASDFVTITEGKNYEVVWKDGGKLPEFDVAYLWAISKTRYDWYSIAYWLHKYHGTRIVYNRVLEETYHSSHALSMEYLKHSEHDLAIPKSAVVFSSSSLAYVEREFQYPFIVKSSTGHQGRGVFKVKSAEEFKRAISEMKKGLVTSFIVREFIPNDGDVRIFTVGYKAIGAMKRTPKEGDFRSNISQGGSGMKFPLEEYPEVQKMAEKASEVMKIEIAGVDVIFHTETGKPYILEVNPGPQFTGLEKFTGVNAAGEIIKYFEKVSRLR